MFAYKTHISMKNFNQFALLGVLLIGSTFFYSCTKMKKDKIDEDWRLIKVSKDSLISHYEAWHFEGETVYMLARQTGGSVLDTMFSAEYTVKAGLSNTILTMKNCQQPIYNGDWNVLTVNKKILIILNRTDGEFIYREFVKE